MITGAKKLEHALFSICTSTQIKQELLLGCMGGDVEYKINELSNCIALHMAVLMGGKSVGDHVLVTELVTYWLVATGRLYRNVRDFTNYHHIAASELPDDCDLLRLTV